MNSVNQGGFSTIKSLGFSHPTRLTRLLIFFHLNSMYFISSLLRFTHSSNVFVLKNSSTISFVVTPDSLSKIQAMNSLNQEGLCINKLLGFFHQARAARLLIFFPLNSILFMSCCFNFIHSSKVLVLKNSNTFSFVIISDSFSKIQAMNSLNQEGLCINKLLGFFHPERATRLIIFFRLNSISWISHCFNSTHSSKVFVLKNSKTSS